VGVRQIDPLKYFRQFRPQRFDVAADVDQSDYRRKFGIIVQHRQSRGDVSQTAPLMQWNDRSFAKAGQE
jgi:hypothetical protein